MAEDCMYCQLADHRRLQLMTWIGELKVSALHLYREQSYLGRCVLVYHEHVQKLTDLAPRVHAAFFKDVEVAAHVLTEVYHPDKINYLILGDLCQHLHIHLVPKYQEGTDWGRIFQMMPEPHKYLEKKQEAVEIQKIRQKLKDILLENL
ncbi:MAG: HIT family protein [Lachnospiraceae bacterium]|jgi:diadenosine tetraphosphate (Ap4A) HIT family hydrolase|nr:HIT family protein [Lachnospiraceae bacterium]